MITRKLVPDSLFYRYFPKENIIEMPFITIEPVQLHDFPETNWVFFSSSNAVDCFFAQRNPETFVKYAAIGEGTAKTLRNHVSKIDFVGKGSPIQVAHQFKEVVGNDLVLFPVSEQSLHTVQKIFPSAQVVNRVVYRTRLLEGLKVPEVDVMMFTSPSNVKGFFSNATLLGTEELIAIGPSTLKEIKKHGFEARMAFTPSEQGLLDKVC